MYDIKFVRENPEQFDEGLKKRALEPQSAMILELDQRRRSIQTEVQELQSRRNDASKQIGVAKKNGEDAQPFIDEVSTIKGRIKEMEEAERDLGAQLTGILESLPNRPADDVPLGADEADNVEVRKWGEVPSFDFEPKQHFELGEDLGYMDFKAAAEISGARFVVLKGKLAQLERAIGQFMLNLHVNEHGYTETSVPLLVQANALYGTGQLPKFEEDLFKTTNDKHYLIPTAEVPLTNLVADQILAETDLPKRFTALSSCFRSEAGSAGRDTRGMLRQHQFYKVEMVGVTKPEDSDAELERMTGCAEKVLQMLGVPYRTVILCTGDMGFSARRTFDIEAWLPGQDTYREISSCSSCGDFQARRMKGRFRRDGEKKATEFVHTLNGSGVAVGRALIAVMENYQQADGSIVVPEVLRPYMGGLDVITKA